MDDGRTDDELAVLDVPQLLRAGFAAADPDGGPRARLFAEGAVAAALQAEAAGVRPRALAFLADVVRAGGVAYAATLPEPLPGRAATALALQWLDAVPGPGVPGSAGSAEDGPAPDAAEDLERWLRDVATVLELRVSVREDGDPPGTRA